MWTLLWLLLTTTGGVTSGASDFTTKEACEAARRQFAEMMVEVNEGEPGRNRPLFAPPPGFRCIQKATGKP